MTFQMNNTTIRSFLTSIRIIIVALIILAVYLVATYLQAALDPPEVEMPDWTFKQLPIQLGDWRGEDKETDKKIFIATGATIVVDRLYQDAAGHGIIMHTGFFKDPAAGVYHSPMNCYRSNGWALKSQGTEKVQITDNKTLEVSFTTWERERDRVYVVFWYQLGEHLLYGRSDLGFKVRWALRGQPQWPVLIKVMLQIPAPAESEEAKPLILDFTKQVATWMNKQEERSEAAGGMNCTIRSNVSTAPSVEAAPPKD
jgi:EpsI family protein